MTKIIKYKYIADFESIKNIYFDNNILYLNNKFINKNFNIINFFFLKNENKGIKLIFDNRNKYNLVFRQLVRIFSHSYRVFFFKLKLRGLGYTVVARVNRKIVKFFFAYNHFFYLHVPKNIFFKRIKRKFFFYSNNLPLLNDLFAKLLKIKKMDFYERSNTFIVPRKILYMKKRK